MVIGENYLTFHEDVAASLRLEFMIPSFKGASRRLRMRPYIFHHLMLRCAAKPSLETWRSQKQKTPGGVPRVFQFFKNQKR